MSAVRSAIPEGWEAVIGLEIHVQLSTRSKMFCRCPNESGGEPNTRICPVCTRWSTVRIGDQPYVCQRLSWRTCVIAPGSARAVVTVG